MAPYEAVISGIGGAFPQSEGLEDFISNLMNSKNLSSVDNQRWKPGLLGTSPHVAKISNVHRFDNNLFKVHNRLAFLMDPLARLMMERSMEAVIDAGLAPQDLADTYTSVYMTTTVSESESRTTSLLHGKKNAGYAIMAGSKTMMSNRISYCLDLKGPSVTLDGDWTVALVAMQRAARSIESGESDFALIGAANTCLFPELNKIYENLGVLSTDGQCRALSADGSGCFRSEGAVVFLLQRADLASRVYARISGVHELCIGTRSRFLGVDTLSLRPLMEDLYQRRGVDVKDVKMLTSDGISIPEIERDELEASAAVLCAGRGGLPVSTPKAAAGHGDAVGAMVSVIHAIAAMEKGLIAPVGAGGPLDAECVRDGRLEVVRAPRPLQVDARSVLAVNTLGYSGCIAHALLRPNEKAKQPISQQSQEFPRLVVVSGRTESDAVRVANQIIDKPFDHEFIRLTQQAFYKPIQGYTSRAVTIIPAEEAGLRPLVASKDADKKDRPVWFVYSGMGSQWAGMGRGLMQLPIFAETIDRLQPVLEPEGIDLRHTLTTENGELFENIVYSFISIAAIQIGLTNVLRALGVQPDGIIGHSTGELGCAYGDGCLSEEETLLAAYSRGRASLAVKLIPGMMASIGLSAEEAKATVPPEVDVACHNSADNCTISGPTEIINQFVDELKEKNVFARGVNVSNIAFHSRYVQPAGPILLDYLLKTIKAPKKRSPRWVASSLKPGDEENPAFQFAGPEFFTNNLLSPVRFEEAMRSVPADAVVIELAPHGLMQPLIRRGLPDGAVTVSLTRRGHRDGLRFLLENVGKLFMECVPVKPWVLAPSVQLPVSRGTACLNSLATWDHREEWPLVINTRSQVSRPRNVPLYHETTACIAQDGRRCAAPAIFLELVWKEVADGKPLESCPVVFQDVEFNNAVEMSGTEETMLVVQIQQETGKFEVVISDFDSNWESICVMKGKVSVPDVSELVGMVSARSEEKEDLVLDQGAVYAELQDNGLKYDDDLKTLSRVAISDKERTGQCEWRGKWHALIDGMVQLAVLAESSGSIFCGKLRKLTIVPQEIRALSSALPVRYLLGSSVVAAPGINMEGYRRAETRGSLAAPGASLGVSLGVRPLQLQAAQEHDDFLQSVAMLRVQNSDPADDLCVVLLEAELEPVADALQMAMRQAVGAQALVRKVVVEAGRPVPAEARGAVLLVTNFRTNQAAAVLAHLAGAGAPGVLVLRCGTRGGHDGFVQVASSVSPVASLSLLSPDRDGAEVAARVVHVQKDEAVPADLQVPAGCGVILVWRGLPREGIFGAVAAVRGKPYGANARMVVILDEDAPDFSPSKEPYRARLRLSLLVNILQDGRWSEHSIAMFNSLPGLPTKVEGYETHVIGLNPGDLHESAQPGLGGFDFCGVKEAVRVMGVASGAREPGAAAEPDGILRWEVPAAWSAQEAATVPMAYAVAYHVLHVLAPVRPGQCVFVQNGESPVSRACIRVAARAGCVVLTTASSEQQRQRVRALNPDLPPEHVLRHDRNTLKYYVFKATGGRRVDVAVVADVRLAGTALQLTALNGTCVTMSKEGALHHHVGMFPFTDSVQMMAAGPQAVLATSERDKRLVHAAVQAGIASGTVRPFAAHAVNSVEMVDVAAVRGPVKQLLLTKDAGGSVNGSRAPRVAFAVAGGRADSAVTLARAAAASGSVMVLAASRDGAGPPPRAKLVPALRHTAFLPLPAAQADAKQFLTLAAKSENIKAVVINLEDAADRSMLSLLHAALPAVDVGDLRLLVLTDSLARGTETVEAWRRRKLAACALVGEPRHAGPLLHTLLTMRDLPAAVVTVPAGTDGRVALGALPHRPLAADPSDLGRTPAAPRVLVEIPSLAPRLRTRHTRLEPLPLFTVTGPVLVPRLVRETASSVMSPVLVADGSRQSPEELAEEILRLQPRGPWAMLGDAENVEVVGQAARLVEERAGHPDWREVVHLAVLESGGRDVFCSPELAALAGTVHFIKRSEGADSKSASLNENKTRHFVDGPRSIATVLNNDLLSPLSKIISC